ncbi:MAG: membrane protein insertion efficiency factor YidD [Kiritimatiellia bacterium]
MRQVLILFVRAYQVVLSPLFAGCCRFEPSCSNYAIEALRVHGAWKGTLLTVRRLLRCRPFGDYGYDPVPPKGEWRSPFEKTARSAQCGCG